MLFPILPIDISHSYFPLLNDISHTSNWCFPLILPTPQWYFPYFPFILPTHTSHSTMIFPILSIYTSHSYFQLHNDISHTSHSSMIFPILPIDASHSSMLLSHLPLTIILLKSTQQLSAHLPLKLHPPHTAIPSYKIQFLPYSYSFPFRQSPPQVS